VISQGALWNVNPETRAADEIASAIFDIWCVSDPEGLVFNHNGVAFICLGRTGVVWHTRRISWDGFDKLRFEGERLSGQAWSPIGDRWLPFSVHLQTGFVEGGSYSWPEVHSTTSRPTREPG
jgi:hypothetical protein